MVDHYGQAGPIQESLAQLMRAVLWWITIFKSWASPHAPKTCLSMKMINWSIRLNTFQDPAGWAFFALNLVALDLAAMHCNRSWSIRSHLALAVVNSSPCMHHMHDIGRYDHMCFFETGSWSVDRYVAMGKQNVELLKATLLHVPWHVLRKCCFI